MRRPRFHPWLGGVVAGVCIFAATLVSHPAIAGDPDQPTGPGDHHHASSAQVTIGRVANPGQGLDPQDRLHVSLAGDPDSPLGTSGDPDSPLGTSGDPDSPLGKKNGSPALNLAIERLSRSQVRIHVGVQGDPDNPTTEGDPDNPTLAFDMGGFNMSAYDVTGRLRRQWNVEDIMAGGGQVFWDMTDDQGRRLASGIYFVRFSGHNSAVTGRVLALH